MPKCFNTSRGYLHGSGAINTASCCSNRMYLVFPKEDSSVTVLSMWCFKSRILMKGSQATPTSLSSNQTKNTARNTYQWTQMPRPKATSGWPTLWSTCQKWTNKTTFQLNTGVLLATAMNSLTRWTNSQKSKRINFISKSTNFTRKLFILLIGSRNNSPK